MGYRVQADVGCRRTRADVGRSFSVQELSTGPEGCVPILSLESCESFVLFVLDGLGV
jgi:hypothetical protein